MSKSHSIEGNIIPFIPEGDFYFSKGIEAYQKQKFDLSLKWFQKAMEEKPDNPLYQCQTSIVYTEIGSYHLANQLLTRVLAKQGEEYIDCYYLIANNYAHLGLLQDAIKYAELYLEKATDGEFREEAATLLEMLDFDDEEEDDNDWTLDEEDDLLMYQETAFYHLEREEWEEAIAVLEEMIALFPEFSQARHEYHYALFFIGERKEAIEMEEKYLQDHPDALFSLMNLAIFYGLEQNNEKSNYYTNMLENIYPIHEQQKLRIAVTFTQIGLYDKALPRFKMLHKSKLKGHPSYYRWYSTCQYYLGMKEEAEQLWREGCKHFQILAEQAPPWK
ncbi:tetratricopeptide repeat protein [Gracilibacillus caseinilyticus]|uniref:Tetratricopeptide repeat protein n=1 Tax=Gracilibacillus caseinilyticus TaxID=2932256 RepID=A0ABY4EVD9_9BACI|nr:tetratricopeptide repeat protein [Gracilibacillus caseinilyticus]UOQ48259.1 tetratricopeptide repeat protein [Gracilibacillus caseinilyticus]